MSDISTEVVVDDIQLYGVYNRTCFRDELNGFTIFTIIVPDFVKERSYNGLVLVNAHIPLYREKTPLYLEGHYEDIPTGKKFVASVVRETVWDEMVGVDYLRSLFSGMKTKRAQDILKCLGLNIFAGASEPDAAVKLANEVTGLNIEKASVIVDAILNTRVQRELFEFLSKDGSFWNIVERLMNRFGTGAKNELIKNPYVGLEVGMKFDQCDKIAADYGICAISQERLNAAVYQSLIQTTKNGDVFVPGKELIKKSQLTLDRSEFLNSKTIPSSIIAIAMNESEDIVIEENDGINNIYLKKLHKAECNVAKQIGRLTKNKVEFDRYFEEIVHYAEGECKIEYSEKQKESFKLLKQSGVAIITGGPGTGKTTTVNGLIKAFEYMYPEKEIKLCAPTGRAAQRMAESTGKEAVTIHRLLEYSPYGTCTHFKGIEDPIDADLIVVDEASMIDVEIASMFLTAVKNGSLVLFIGDIDQLPSVAAGDVLHDLIESEKVPTVKLTTNYRQSEKSPIVHNAIVINEAKRDKYSWKKSIVKNDDFQIEIKGTADDVAKRCIDLLVEYYNPEKPFDTQILCPSHKSAAGVAELNKAAQDILNPKKEGDKILTYGNRQFRVNDKIIMMHNNYDDGYFNGDIGIVKEIKTEGLVVHIMGRDINITKSKLDDVALAYAITIHKSQGSEFSNVIMALPAKPDILLKRNLVYTGITRAKKKVKIISEIGALEKAVENVEKGKRKTRLAKRIIEEFPD